ncbi:MAG: C45 family peptidase, partial [Bacteroidota bacterium]
AHDIGHALQDLALVGCSSFAAWGDKTEDGQLIIGRNFDFYVGDEFARNKIIAFVKPEQGHNFMSVSWGGFIGVLSGMNDQGLTVTINAGKSNFPLVAKTPISLVTREILQYASTIEEAIAIAKKREVFVSESILIGSAKDKQATIIEVSPKNFGVYEVPNSANELICSNHFQSAAYAQDKKNQDHISESHSQYRFNRMEELLEKPRKVNPEIAVDILRNTQGLDNAEIGYGNEKALNQLLAHHGIVFKPGELMVWVSSNPYQLGEFVAFDLKKIFATDFKVGPSHGLSTASKDIPADPFLHSPAYKDYERYRKLYRVVKRAISEESHLSPDLLQEFEKSNPEFWEVYYLAGLYNYKKGYDTVAMEAFSKAASKEITTVPDKERVEGYIRKLKRRLN